MLTAATRAVVGSFVQHWAVTARPGEAIYVACSQVAAVSVFAWLARLGGRQEVITSIAFGVVLMVIWRASVFQLGFQLRAMNSQGTLELELMSRAPMFAIMLGKSLAAFVFYGLIGVGCFGVAIWIGGAGLTIADPLALAISLLVGAAAVIATSFIFAPFTFVVGGQSGFFNAIFPIGIVLSGFVQPTALLPPAIGLAARAIPTSWAMEALLLSLGGAPWEALAPRWATALALCAAMYVLAALLFVRAEARVREQGGAE